MIDREIYYYPLTAFIRLGLGSASDAVGPDKNKFRSDCLARIRRLPCTSPVFTYLIHTQDTDWLCRALSLPGLRFSQFRTKYRTNIDGQINSIDSSKLGGFARTRSSSTTTNHSFFPFHSYNMLVISRADPINPQPRCYLILRAAEGGVKMTRKASYNFARAGLRRES